MLESRDKYIAGITHNIHTHTLEQSDYNVNTFTL